MADRDNRAAPARPEVETERVDERAAGCYYTPRIDVYETSEAILVEADMPGVAPTAVEVKIDHGLLTVVGRVQRRPAVDVTQLYEEYVPGDFYRAFSLGEQVDDGAISAVMKDGVLTVKLPKSPKTRPRSITVEG
jgi:HSP20 family molecular chaperone IbpA